MNIGIIFGGKSAEHEVSLESARNIVAALDRDKFTPVLIGISKRGEWFLCDEIPKNKVDKEGERMSIIPGGGSSFLSSGPDIDVVFPALHGPNGEDGTIQGLFRMVDIPFVSPGVLSSAVAMDKEASKTLLKNRGIKVVDWITLRGEVNLKIIEEKFDYPVFVKPANLGSSVGVSKAKNRKELKEAVSKAFEYDKKILVEEFINGRELECSVLGNKNPEASRLGEIKPKDKFYSYEEKYSNQSRTELIIPANIEDSLEEKLQNLAVEAFKANMCKGMARVDFLVKDQEIYVNELNTIPGFTEISMYPKLWQESDLDYPDLITKLIQLAVESHNNRKDLKTSY